MMLSTNQVLNNLSQNTDRFTNRKPFRGATDLNATAQILAGSTLPTVNLFWGIHPVHVEANQADRRTLLAMHSNLESIAGQEIAIRLIFGGNYHSSKYAQSITQMGSALLADKFSTTNLTELSDQQAGLKLDANMLISLIGSQDAYLFTSLPNPILFSRAKAKSGAQYIPRAPWQTW